MSKLEELIGNIDKDVVWRKKEVSTILLMENNENTGLIVKMNILFIYSHWEGCIKNICQLYLEYVSTMKVELSKLTDNFKAIYLKGKIGEIIKSSESLTMSNELSFMESLDNRLCKKFRLKKKDDAKDKSILDTQSNLKYKIFESFLKITGVGEKSCLLTKQTYIDEKLLSNRNKIAHGNKVEDGEYNEIDLNIVSVKKLKKLIFLVIDSLATDIKHYAENEFFLACNEAERKTYNQLSNKKLEKELNKIEL